MNMWSKEVLINKAKSRTGVIVLAILVIAFLRACVFTKKAEVAVQRAAPVTVAKVVKKDMPMEIYAVGAIEAYSSVAVNSQVSGILQTVHIIEGQYVKKGDLLFTVDPAPFEAALKERQANVEVAKARAENARLLLQRYEKLIKQDYITQVQYDQAKADKESLEASVRAGEAAVENAKLQLSYTKITSPLDGRAGDLLVKAGNLLKANDAGSIMLKINQICPVFARFSVPERYLLDIQKQMVKGPLEVRVQIKGNEQAQSAVGVLSFVDNSVDRSTGTILLKATFPNEDHMLWPGQFVDVHLVLKTIKDALVIPNAAIMTGQNGAYVFVVGEGDKVNIQGVIAEYSLNNETIISQGLKFGQTIVTDGQLNLGPETPVRIKQ